MANDQVSIYNLALNAVGARSNISLPTEDSREAEVCNLWYQVIVDQVFASAAWPEARDFDYLALIEEQDDGEWQAGEPLPGFRYVYAYPADCLRPQHLVSFNRFRVMNYNGDQLAINTNAPETILVYTKRVTNIALWSPELKMAIVYGLAANICMPLTGKTSRADVLLGQANSLILAARETAANTDDYQLDALPDWIAARGFVDSSARTKFYYPYGSLLTMGSANVS